MPTSVVRELTKWIIICIGIGAWVAVCVELYRWLLLQGSFLRELSLFVLPLAIAITGVSTRKIVSLLRPTQRQHR